MFHLWPQGRIVRLCVLGLGALLAVDLGYNGAFAAFAAYFGDTAGAGAKRQLILGCTYGLLGFGALLAAFIAAGPHRRAVQFLIEVQEEMVRVTWPKPGELWRSTLVVAVGIAVLAGVVYLSDLALLSGLNYIQK